RPGEFLPAPIPVSTSSTSLYRGRVGKCLDSLDVTSKTPEITGKTASRQNRFVWTRARTPWTWPAAARPRRAGRGHADQLVDACGINPREDQRRTGIMVAFRTAPIGRRHSNRGSLNPVAPTTG